MAARSADTPEELAVDQHTAARTLQHAVDRVLRTQREAISGAARRCADALEAGGILQAFGTGHSQALAMELAGRAGGFVAANRLALKQLVMAGRAAPEEVVGSAAERSVDLAQRLWELHEIGAADV
ncbi:MAG: SIS domain-containing protein, partial [Actinophytocola sp.]|nr:SIS domain-containing protein [Actinophytocola sp.]